MSYYWFNRKEILQKAKERYSRKKTPEYYLENKEKHISNWFRTKKDALQNKWVLFVLSIRTSEKTLRFDNVRLNNIDSIKKNSTITNSQSI